MISKSQISLIKKLCLKKQRMKTNLFIAEGQKVVQECISEKLKIHRLYSLESLDKCDSQLISTQEMRKISNFKTPSEILGLFEIPSLGKMKIQKIDIVLDRIQDPANLGTIIRLCDWFGFQQLICSEDSVDCYHPKVVQASMGSISRVRCHYRNLQNYFQNQTRAVYGTSSQGVSLNDFAFEEAFVLLFGNESKGISKNLYTEISKWISVDKYSKKNTVDSLNVASVVGICMYKIRNENHYYN